MGPAAACPACLNSNDATLTIVQQLVDSDQVSLAELTDDKRRFRVITPIRGPQKPGDEISLTVAQAPWNGPSKITQIILGRHLFTKQWSILGQIEGGHEEWLIRAASQKRTKSLTNHDWEGRVSVFLSDLISSEPLIRSTAHAELSRAPYQAIKSQGSRIKTELLLRLIDTPHPTDNRSLIILLLGISGDATARAWINHQINRNIQNKSSADLAALMTAKIEIEKEEALSLIDEQYIKTSIKNPDEVHAVQIALSIQGQAASAIDRRSLSEAYLKLVTKYPELVGYAASDFQNWGYWDLAPVIQNLAENNDLDDGSRLLVSGFIAASPRMVK